MSKMIRFIKFLHRIVLLLLLLYYCYGYIVIQV